MLQYPHADRRRRIVEAGREETAPVVENHGQVARLAGCALRDNGAVEQPRVSLPQRLLRLAGDPHRQPPFSRCRESGENVHGLAS